MARERDAVIKYTADVVVINTANEVLLIKRGFEPFAGRWALPGGHVNKGETARQGGARELLEESGVAALEDELLPVGVFDAPDRDPRGRYVSVAFRLDVIVGTSVQPGDDAVMCRWFHLDDLPPLAFDHADIIRAARDV